jgi:hypothetical protein
VPTRDAPVPASGDDACDEHRSGNCTELRAASHVGRRPTGEPGPRIAPRTRAGHLGADTQAVRGSVRHRRCGVRSHPDVLSEVRGADSECLDVARSQVSSVSFRGAGVSSPRGRVSSLRRCASSRRRNAQVCCLEARAGLS